MKKTAIAVAVASTFAAPLAMAAQSGSSVQIGGSLTLFYYQHNPNNPAASQKTDILEMSEPEMFVRGEENLGGGLRAWFQCTSSLDGMVTGAANAQGLCGRNSGIGFRGSFGNVFAGNWDSPEKLVFNRARQWWGGTNSLTGGTARLLENNSASGAGLPINSLGVGTTNNPPSFFRRQAQSWNYHSPSWGGFRVNAAFSAANEHTGIPEAAVFSPRMWSLGGHYDAGPLLLAVGFEQHQDFNPAGVAVGAGAAQYNGGDDEKWLIVGGYRFGPVSLRLMYSRTEYDVTNTTSLKHTGYAAYGDWNLGGPHTLRFQYALARDTKGSAPVPVGVFGVPGADNGAKVYGLAYSYAFSKRTEGSLVYTRLSNDSAAAYSLGKVAAVAGNNQTSAGMVLKHRF